MSPKHSKVLEHWDTENPALWQQKERKIANRNFWISTICMLLSFAIWQYWSIISVQMASAGYPFTTQQFFILPAMAGLMGATLRIPQAFVIALAGGRNTTFVTMLLLLVPAFFTGLALQSLATPFWVFVLLSALSGIGGGAFASIISNLGWFFPKKRKGIYLGLSAGIGNLGVSVMQFVLPLIVLWNVFGLWSGSPPYIANSGYIWILPLLLLALASFWGLDNLRVASPHLCSTPIAIFKILSLFLIGLATGGVGIFLLLYWHITEWIVLPLVILLTVSAMKLLPGVIRKSVRQQFAIFRNKHTWILTYVYTMTLGSFIGFSAAFPLLIKSLFGGLGTASAANAPNPFMYAWIGPFLASIVRPIGGMLADKWRGSRISFWVTICMIITTVATGFVIHLANTAPNSLSYFIPFLLLFLLLFVLTGLGNGSIYQMMAHAFTPHESGPVMGWASSVSAYGAYLIPSIFGAQIALGRPSYALYGFAAYYLTCLFLLWYYYLRKHAEIEC